MGKRRKPAAVDETEAAEKTPKRDRKVVYISLDEATDAALERFRADQRIPPERSAVGFTALVEFLSREGYKP